MQEKLTLPKIGGMLESLSLVCAIPKGVREKYSAWEARFICKEACKVDAEGIPLVNSPFGKIACPIYGNRPSCPAFPRICAAIEDLQAKEWEEAITAHLKYVGVPGRVLQADIKTADDSMLIKGAKAWIKTGFPAGKCLVLVGVTGTGKSFTIAACLREAMRMKRIQPMYHFAASMFNSIRYAEFEQKQILIEQLSTCRLLAIDDLATEDRTDFTASTLDQIINEREGNNRATILTTNKAPVDFPAVFGERIADRLRGSWGMVYACKDTSRRKKS